MHSPKIEKIEVVRHGKVRRAKLYYLRDKVGKAAKIKEKGILSLYRIGAFGRGPSGPLSCFIFHALRHSARVFRRHSLSVLRVRNASSHGKESSPRNEGNEWLKRLQKYERH